MTLPAQLRLNEGRPGLFVALLVLVVVLIFANPGRIDGQAITHHPSLGDAMAGPGRWDGMRSRSWN
jgi:hypothetical protein